VSGPEVRGVPVLGNASEIATPTLLPAFWAPSTIEELRDAVLELWSRMSVVAVHYQQTEYRFPERHFWETLQALNIFNMTHGGTLPSTRKDGTPLQAGDMHGDYSQDGIPLRPLIYDGADWVSFLLDIQPGGALIDHLLEIVLGNSQVVNAPNAALVNALRTELRDGVATDRDTLKKLSDAIDAVTPDTNNLALTGIPTAPTAAPGTDSTQLATTAFVKAAADAAATAGAAAGAAMNLAQNEVIWVEGNHSFNGGTVGCTTAVTGNNVCPLANRRPSIVIVNGDASFAGTPHFYGMLFVMGNSSSTGNVTVHGAMAIGGSASSSGGSFDIWYNTNILARASMSGAAASSAGTWKDF
jgi:hypothetical protein